MPSFDLHSAAFWIVLCFALACIYQAFIYLGLFGKVAFYKETEPRPQELPPVSVIICAKNEADNLTEFLPKILSQEYPDFEVVVVNDCSWDNTEDVLREYGKLFPNMKVITIKEDEYYKHGKKFALMVGIKGARYEHLLFTDGDCYPRSENWIREMIAGYTAGKEIVIGYGPYIREKSFLNKLIRFDAFTIALQYLSWGISGKAYMGVGRNLSYKKELFFRNKGFATHYHINSGDDDLFVNQATTASNTAVVLSQGSFTYSIPAKDMGEWTRQKSRHLSTSGFYTGTSRNRLALVHGGNYLFWLMAIAAFCQPDWILITAILFILKNIVQAITFYKAGQRLDEKDLVPGFLLCEFLLLFLYPVWHFNKRFAKTAKWKS